MLRVLIADDHQIVRRAVREVVAEHPGWEVCGEAADGREALELAIREQPDVAVLDISLPLLNGVALTRRLKQDLPKTRVLLFTMCDDEVTVSAGLSAGAGAIC
ncbi:response regulator transcription factor [Phenylobacterium sp. J367]|uniref:response regulator n=1 Tax=Phenylobacterium sp. J367 TaxID=2898435 RepID=UPI002150CBAA|nr:response regulator transcription factor [Phenylobacterium sp. J367]MCR5879436.1 response regulator transcription factor [Phenylobacterium sp. J367]